MKATELVGTWKETIPDTGTYTVTLELSGKFTCVMHYKGIVAFYTSILGGNEMEGTWQLNQDGTEIEIQFNKLNCNISWIGSVIVGIIHLFASGKSKITEIDKNHLKLTNNKGEESFLERL